MTKENFNPVELGNLVRVQLRIEGYTLESLAAKLKLRRKTLTHYLNDERNMPAYLYFRLKKKFNLCDASPMTGVNTRVENTDNPYWLKQKMPARFLRNAGTRIRSINVIKEYFTDLLSPERFSEELHLLKIPTDYLRFSSNRISMEVCLHLMRVIGEEVKDTGKISKAIKGAMLGNAEAIKADHDMNTTEQIAHFFEKVMPKDYCAHKYSVSRQRGNLLISYEANPLFPREVYYADEHRGSMIQEHIRMFSEMMVDAKLEYEQRIDENSNVCRLLVKRVI